MSSFGEELKRERELRRITLREVADSTKISVRHLEALEKNEFDNLPGGVFNRGFVRAYAQYIGIDPDSTVTSYLMEEQSRVPDTAYAHGRDGVLRRAPEPAIGARMPALGPVGTRMLLGALAILLLTVVALILWRWNANDADSAEPVEPVPSSAIPTEGSGEDSALALPFEDEEEAAGLAALAEAPSARGPAPTADEPVPPAASPAPADALLTRIQMLRPTSGRVDCDNTRIELLDGLRAGTTIEFLCRRFLVIDADDGGAVEIGVGREAPRVLGRDGERIAGKRINVAERRAAGNRP